MEQIKQLEEQIKTLEKQRKKINKKIEKIKKQIKKLKEKLIEKQKQPIELTQIYFTDASIRNTKAKIAIYSPTKNIKKSKEIPFCNTDKAELLAIQWAIEHALTQKDIKAIIKNDNKSVIEKVKTKYKKHSNIRFEWTQRKHNKIADKLAKV